MSVNLSEEELAINIGEHYKQTTVLQSEVGQPFDPAFVADKLGLSFMRATALKKIVAMGERGKKSYLEDLTGAISALEREKDLYELSLNRELEQRCNMVWTNVKEGHISLTPVGPRDPIDEV